MQIININATQPPSVFGIGRRGENEVTQVDFDFASWVREFGTGAVTLLVKRSQDESAYPVTVTTADNLATWIVTATDTQYVGRGKLEFKYTVDEQVKKSVVFGFNVAEDIGNPASTPPDPYETWLETLTDLEAETLQHAEDAAGAAVLAEEAASHYPIIIDDYWYVWDVEGEDYVNTGVKASGGGSGGTDDYNDLSNKPQIAGTTLSGNKSLSDLGAEPEALFVTVTQSGGTFSSDKTYSEISTAVSAGARVEANYMGNRFQFYGFEDGSNAAQFSAQIGVQYTVVIVTTQNYVTVVSGSAGSYSKPYTGIPKSDLASAVQTSLDRADSALQSAPVTSVNSKTGAVTLNASDVGSGTYSKPSGGIPDTDLTSAVQTSLGKADSAYQKPSGGIPSSDMASAVQTSLGKADTAYQKPAGGIPAADIASGVIPTVPTNVSSFTNDAGYLTLATLPVYNGGVS